MYNNSVRGKYLNTEKRTRFLLEEIENRIQYDKDYLVK